MQTVAYLQLFLAQKYNVTGNKYKFAQTVKVPKQLQMNLGLEQLLRFYLQ